MAEFYNISNWTALHWETPQKGTRSQKIVVSPYDNENYYFKLSKDIYQSEFWSEIIASKIGQKLGFNVLDYNIACLNDSLGCLSKTMVNKEVEIIYHGVDILNYYLDDFKIIKNPVYSFQNIQELSNKGEFFFGIIDYFINVAFFDAIIGNTDRHSENWAVVEKNKIVEKSNFLDKLINDILCFVLGKKSIIKLNKIEYSPIYDNGSCLGREIAEDRVLEFVKDEQKIQKYLNRGKSEIRWNEEHLSLFDVLVRLKESYPDKTKKVYNRIMDSYDENSICTLIDNIDNNARNDVPETYLSLRRKELIKTLIVARVKRIQKALSD